MADLLHRLASELGIESGSLGPELLVSLLRDARNALVQQVRPGPFLRPEPSSAFRSTLLLYLSFIWAYPYLHSLSV